MTQISGHMFGLLALLIAGSPAAQTTYPEKPIHMVVGFPAGSQVDTVARLLGQQFAEAWGTPVLIDNVSGATGNIGAARVRNAAPDGYTLGLLGEAALVINPSLYKLAYDPVKDFAPVSQVYRVVEYAGRAQRRAGEEFPGADQAGQSAARRVDFRLRRQR